MSYPVIVNQSTVDVLEERERQDAKWGRAVQVAAVALAFVERLDRRKWRWPGTDDPNA